MPSSDHETKNIDQLRREYAGSPLLEKTVADDPMQQFRKWLTEAIRTEPFDPTAMVLSTIDPNGYPDSRVVLLKDLSEATLSFYTNYHSVKAEQLKYCSRVAVNFYWPTLARQVRIRGKVDFTPADKSDEYFMSRPLKSRLSAIISPQSKRIDDPEVLHKRLQESIEKLSSEDSITRPEYWGGYIISPSVFEFWQGRKGRLHDRILYTHENNIWHHCRLAP